MKQRKKSYALGGEIVQNYASPMLEQGMQGGLSTFGVSSSVPVFEKGGQPEVKILNKDEVFDEEKYKGILDDFDMDGIPNADDPHPRKKGDAKTIEQLQFSDTFKKVLKTKKGLDKDLTSFVGKLQKGVPNDTVIYGRTKTPFSILNKLVSSRLLDEKRGLKDLVGTTVAFNTTQELKAFARRLEKGVYGKVLDYDDYYANPNDGYRAYHFIIEHDGVPIEVQLKTMRMKEINILSHDAYKNKRLNKDYMLYLTTLADEADKGNKSSQEEFDKLMERPSEVENKLNN